MTILMTKLQVGCMTICDQLEDKIRIVKTNIQRQVSECLDAFMLQVICTMITYLEQLTQQHQLHCY